jgi:hypothetical protein
MAGEAGDAASGTLPGVSVSRPNFAPEDLSHDGKSSLVLTWTGIGNRALFRARG